MNKTDEMNDQVWNMINKEKQKDKFLKTVNAVAWGVTLLVLIIFGVYTWMDFSRTLRLYNNGMMPFENVISTTIPFLIILGSISLLMAILATIGRFLRLRTTSLLELQQRLTNLEKLILTKD